MMRLISQSHTFVLGHDTGLQILTENVLIIGGDIPITVKILKIQTPKNFAVITLKFKEVGFTVE